MRSSFLLLALLPGAALAEGAGKKAALFHCARCHVVPGGNPFGGIGSTPSFAVMRGYDQWRVRFEGFYAEPPHVAITQIDGLTDPFERPSPIAPMVMTKGDLEAIVAFVEGIEVKRVGSMD